MDYEAVIGLEVHVQLKTKSKIFCGCSTNFGAEPNSQTCPVCLGLPGVLPVLNKQAVVYAIKSALALNCQITKSCKFHRKNYFYPDLPKAYQISQYDEPLSKEGYIEIEGAKIGITRVHLEEDAGKLIHTEKKSSLVDFNRCGIPLIEIVSKPDLKTPQQAYKYLTSLKSILEYIEVSDCNMEEGSLRCDANVSIRPIGKVELGTKTEVKNMNSFKAVEKALSYEIERQIKVIKQGKNITQETRLWDEKKQITTPMRSKEEAHDYRYFPEPDLVPLEVSQQWVNEIKTTIPQLPQARRKRFIEEYKLPPYDAEVLTATKALAEFYENTTKIYPEPKIVSNWIMTEVLGYLAVSNLTITQSKLTSTHLASMLKLIDKGTISGKIGKEVLTEIFKTGKTPEEIIKEKGLVQITDEDEIVKIVEQVITENPKAVEEYKAGKKQALGFLVGQVMKLTRGKANPKLTNKLLQDKL
ncbi:MAG: Asp-tRNA(Asn)/Glu-tRNA(Gln) amidotransferase subunit GatB [bacterium]